MAPIAKCPKCGLDLADASLRLCPMCGASIPVVAGPGRRIWLGAILQLAVASIFVLVLGLPKFTILFFAPLTLIGIALSLRQKANPQATRSLQRPVVQSTRFQVLTLSAALCGFVCFACILFGFVAFINPWSNFQRYKDQSYHRADFQVMRVYYQRQGKGTSLYASGKVEGQREWMSLEPYLGAMRPHSQSELEDRVPMGTSIPIYLFPDMKGRLRVRIYQDVPTAEAYRQAAMNALHNGLTALVICGGTLFVLLRLRSACRENSETAFPGAVYPGAQFN